MVGNYRSSIHLVCPWKGSEVTQEWSANAFAERGVIRRGSLIWQMETSCDPVAGNQRHFYREIKLFLAQNN